MSPWLSFLKKRGVVLAKIVSFVAPTFSLGVFLTLRAMRIHRVFIADVGEEMKLILGKEQRCGNTVHGGITPSLWKRINAQLKSGWSQLQIPHSKILQIYTDGRNKLNRLGLARSPYLRFRSYSRLCFRVGITVCTHNWSFEKHTVTHIITCAVIIR